MITLLAGTILENIVRPHRIQQRCKIALQLTTPS